MKQFFTIAFISASLFSFGQSEMFWNNYANFNPAMSGFQYDQHATATYYTHYPNVSIDDEGLFADAGITLKKNHGLGVVYTGDFNNFWGSHKALVNYNYQFHFEKAGKLALGTGMGFGRYSAIDPLLSNVSAIEKQHLLELNLGATYNWKNLYVGFSVTNSLPMDDPEGELVYINSSPRGYYFHAQHTTRIAENFQVLAHVLYSYQNGFQRLHPNLTLTYLEKFSLGVSYQARDSFGVNAGWDILNQFCLAYNFSSTISPLNNGFSGGKHEISFAYRLK